MQIAISRLRLARVQRDWVTDLIDLRQFLRVGDRGSLMRPDGADAVVQFTHISTRWATVEASAASLEPEMSVRAELRRDGTRLVVQFEVLDVTQRGGVDVCELRAGSAVVLGERAARHSVDEGAATAILVLPGDHVTRVPVRVVDVSASGVSFQAEDRFAPGDEITLVRDGEHAFRVRLRVVRRGAGNDGHASFGCRVIAATEHDEEELRAFAAAH
jgi:hypothetical protein